MTLIYSLIFVLVLSMSLTTFIKKYSKLFFGLASIASILTICYESYRLLTKFKLTGILGELERSVNNGYLSIGFFALVMFAGLFYKKGVINRKLFLIRAENAILGTILIMPHGIMYLVKFINNLLQGKPTNLLYIIFIAVGVISFVIMVPLFITSFK